MITPPPDLHIRDLTSFDELEACVALQKETWGVQFDDVVSAATLMVSQKVGGIVAGAFDEAGTLVGVVYGLTGIRNGRLVHWSHMLAVRAAWQNRGLGRHLKAYQRRSLLDRGIRVMYWTFDPLESRNAHFNLNRLGAEVDEYARDLYGTGSTSPLHAGIGTDRFIVRWSLDAPRVEQALADRLPAPDVFPAEAPIGNDERVNAERVRIEIPSNIQGLKARSLAEAVRWRSATREAFEYYLGRGYAVEGFYHRPDAGAPEAGRSFYVLRSHKKIPPLREQARDIGPQNLERTDG